MQLPVLNCCSLQTYFEPRKIYLACARKEEGQNLREPQKENVHASHVAPFYISCHNFIKEIENGRIISIHRLMQTLKGNWKSSKI